MLQMNKITLILNTKNEEENIKNNFYWLKEFPKINEIINIDDNSTDNTISEIKKLQSKTLKVHTYTRNLNHNFSSQHQFGISKSTNDWILWLDADEQPSVKLIEFINNIDSHRYHNYAFKRVDIFLGKQLKHGETSSQYFLRLFNKKHGKFKGMVHEIWDTNESVQNINLDIIHESHKTLRSFFNKINYYSEIRANELYQSGVKTNLFQIILYTKAKFILNYFIRLGFLDGTPGIILALGMSFHTFLVRAKLWSLLHP